MMPSCLLEKPLLFEKALNPNDLSPSWMQLMFTFAHPTTQANHNHINSRNQLNLVLIAITCFIYGLNEVEFTA